MRRYTYNPNAENLEFNADVNALAVIDGCIAFNGLGALYDRGRYIPDSENVILNTTEQASDSVVTNPTLNVTGSGMGALYVLSGSTTEEDNPIANRTIIANQITNGLARVVGQTISDESGNFYMGLDTTNNSPVLATAYQEFGAVWQAEVNLNINDVIRPTVANGFVYRVKIAGITGAVEPNWPTINATEFTDGTVTFIADVYYQPVSHTPIELQTNALIEFTPTIEQHDSCPIPVKIADYIPIDGWHLTWANDEAELFNAVALNSEDLANSYTAHEHSNGYRVADEGVTANLGHVMIYRDIDFFDVSGFSIAADQLPMELHWEQVTWSTSLDQARGVLIFIDDFETEISRVYSSYSDSIDAILRTLDATIPVGTKTIRVGFETYEMDGNATLRCYFKDINITVLPYVV